MCLKFDLWSKEYVIQYDHKALKYLKGQAKFVWEKREAKQVQAKPRVGKEVQAEREKECMEGPGVGVHAARGDESTSISAERKKGRGKSELGSNWLVRNQGGIKSKLKNKHSSNSAQH